MSALQRIRRRRLQAVLEDGEHVGRLGAVEQISDQFTINYSIPTVTLSLDVRLLRERLERLDADARRDGVDAAHLAHVRPSVFAMHSLTVTPELLRLIHCIVRCANSFSGSSGTMAHSSDEMMYLTTVNEFPAYSKIRRTSTDSRLASGARTPQQRRSCP